MTSQPQHKTFDRILNAQREFYRFLYRSPSKQEGVIELILGHRAYQDLMLDYRIHEFFTVIEPQKAKDTEQFIRTKSSPVMTKSPLTILGCLVTLVDGDDDKVTLRFEVNG
jgi:hypothetical protein